MTEDMKVSQKKTATLSDAELMAEYRAITAYLAGTPGYSMGLNKRIAENRQESLIAEGLDRGLFRRG